MYKRLAIPIVSAIIGVFVVFSIFDANNANAQFTPRIEPAATFASLGTAFTYQGHLTDAGQPANGSYDFIFDLYDSETTGTGVLVGSISLGDETVSDGLFTVVLDYSDVFDGTALWLEIRVRPGGSVVAYTTLEPRQALSATPYASYATKAGSIPWTGISQIPTGFSDAIDDDILAGLICATNEIAKWDGSIWSCAPDQTGGSSGWSLTGNAGTTAGTNFLGTTDDEPMELHVNGLRAFLLEPGPTSPNIIAGYGGNSAGASTSGATIGGGGRDLAINQVDGDYGTVGGGAGNMAGGYASFLGGGEGNKSNGSFSTVAGGADNFANDPYTTIGGGHQNNATGDYATIGGGHGNLITDTSGTIAGGGVNAVYADYATVGGGLYNRIAGAYGTIAGGGPSDLGNPTTSNNRVFDDYGTISGGGGNVSGSNEGDATYATVGGGQDNTASGSYATSAGGEGNTAGAFGATAGGGTGNNATSNHAVVSGGTGNTASGNNATVSGGASNTASQTSATVGGGSNNTASGSYTVVGGGNQNQAGGDYAAISGGISNTINADYAALGGGQGNLITGTHGTIAGGVTNTVSADYAAIGGGEYNYVTGIFGIIAGGGPSDLGNPTSSNNQVLDNYGTVSGGGGNVSGSNEGDATYATVGGGKDNTASGEYATAGGGNSNTASAYGATIGGGNNNNSTSNNAVIAGGTGNTASGNNATVSGGNSNTAGQTSATVSGGFSNMVAAPFGTIPGGTLNYVSGTYGFAAGNQARSEHQGSFVWSDSSGGFSSTGNNQFLIDADGGVGIGTNTPSYMLTVAGDAAIRSSAVISVGAIVSHPGMLQSPRALYAVGDLLYATGYATNTLSIWNMANPATQDFIGYTTFQLAGPSDLQVVGNRAYIASTNRDMLTILDVSDPSDISHVGDTIKNLGRPVAVHVSGKYAFVASKGRSSDGLYDGLTVFDVTDAPAELAATSFISTYLQGTSDVFVSHSYAYLTSRDNNRLVVFDVSNPGAIVPVSYTEESLVEPVKVHVSGIYAYVVAEGTDTLVAFDVSNPTQIAVVGQVTTTLTHPRSLYISADRAYLAYAGDAGTGEQCGLAVLDISDPLNMAVLNVIDMSDWLKWIDIGTVEEPVWVQVPPKPVAITGSGTRVYMANERHDSVFVFEIDGLEASAVRVGELQVAQLEVADYAAIEGDLGVRGGLNIGPGGALIQGALTVESVQDSTIRGRLGIGPVATVITRSVSVTESEEIVMRHPTHQLDVDGEARFRINSYNHLILRSQNTGSDEDAYIDFARFDHTDLLTTTARIAFDSADPYTHTTSIEFSTQGSGDPIMVQRFVIDSNGDAHPSYDNQYSLGTIDRRWTSVWATNGTIQTSDGRLKDRLTALPFGLSEINQLRPVAFIWSDGPADEVHYGLVAQEVMDVLPELVRGGEDPQGTLGMNYSELVPVLIRAVQEQQEEIDTQAEQIVSMDARLAALEGLNDTEGYKTMELNLLNWIGIGGLLIGAVGIVRRQR